jgi:hypothetical protein
MDFGNKEIVTANYVPNSLWDLKAINNYSATPIDRFQYYYPTYAIDQTIYEIVVKRRPLYFMMNSIFPCLVLNIITLLAFALPFANQMALGLFKKIVFVFKL